MGWNYVMQWAFVLPLELTVCGTVIQYWAPETNVAIWVTVSHLHTYKVPCIGRSIIDSSMGLRDGIKD